MDWLDGARRAGEEPWYPVGSALPAIVEPAVVRWAGHERAVEVRPALDLGGNCFGWLAWISNPATPDPAWKCPGGTTFRQESALARGVLEALADMVGGVDDPEDDGW